MDILKQYVCRDIFNLILSFYDPIVEAQKKHKNILYWTFKMSEFVKRHDPELAVSEYYLWGCHDRLLRNIRTSKIKDMDYLYEGFKSVIFNKHYIEYCKKKNIQP